MSKYIPEVSEEKIKELFSRIKPVIDYNGVKKYIKDVDPFNISYIWSPKTKGIANNLIAIKDIITYHSYGYYGLFKPSIAEVLAQIPDDIVDKVDAFEIIEHPECAEDLNDNSDALNDGFHVAKTRLYEIKR